MWLVYLRFDDQGKARTYHFRTSSKADVQEIVKLAEKRGLTKTAKLEEYAAFYTSGSINLKRFISGRAATPMCELGWKSLGVLELTALPSIDKERWVTWVRETDVLLVNGGDALYLSYWMRQSGLADLLPSLRETVWVGLSAGSVVMTPRIGQDFVGWKPPSGGDATLGVVDFSIFPHLDHPALPENTIADAERWAAGILSSAYAIDDETAIKVVDGTVEIISEGHWKRFVPAS